MSVTAHILAAKACTTSPGIVTLDHIVRFSDPKRKTTALEAKELHWLVNALLARGR